MRQYGPAHYEKVCDTFWGGGGGRSRSMLRPHLLARFPDAPRARLYADISPSDWTDWTWQARHSLKTEAQFEKLFNLSPDERAGFQIAKFRVQTTPYYASLISPSEPHDPLRLMTLPRAEEALGEFEQLDPLGERRNQVSPRLIHRYSDRVLLWVTDTCGIYCRYCTRKHFTAQGHAMAKSSELEQAFQYIRRHTGIREVILSGGDPLTTSNQHLESVLSELREIPHVELIRLGSRLIVANPFRIDQELARIFRNHAPVVFMSHFNHPRELTRQALQALTLLVDHGVPVFNQMVLLNGVNNHAAIVHALSRRLLLARVKPYYMFQCDPSEGTDHLRTNFDQSLQIQKELWGHSSGLAMPQLSLDIPSGGGKAYAVPNFEISHDGDSRKFKGWDGVEAEYKSPAFSEMRQPLDVGVYQQEWESVRHAKTNSRAQSLVTPEIEGRP